MTGAGFSCCGGGTTRGEREGAACGSAFGASAAGTSGVSAFGTSATCPYEPNSVWVTHTQLQDHLRAPDHTVDCWYSVSYARLHRLHGPVKNCWMPQEFRMQTAARTSGVSFDLFEDVSQHSGISFRH